MRTTRISWLLYSLLAMLSMPVRADDAALDRLLALDLGQLQNIQVSSVSGVTESARHAPAALVVITAEDLRRGGYDSLPELLQDLPGFDVSVSGGTNYATAWQRGYRSPFGQRTLLLIDGVVTNELWSQAPDLSRQYPLLALERIEVLYGPASAVYGANAFAGVINLITRRADDADSHPHGEWRLRTGSYATRSAEGSYRQHVDDWHLAASVRLFRSDDPSLHDLQGRQGFVSADWLANREVWGPILAISNHGQVLGQYHDPALDHSVLVNLDVRGWQAGLFWARANEGYGMEYATDHAQVNVPWLRERAHAYLEHHDDWASGALSTRLTWRRSGEHGEWAEASPAPTLSLPNGSLVSYSHWNTRSQAYSLEQKLDIPGSAGWQDWRWLAGWKVEHRDLTRAYAICGYWEPDSYCPVALNTDSNGPAGAGPWVVPSSALSLPASPSPMQNMDDSNLVQVNTRNAHLQATWSHAHWQSSTGLLLEHHTDYGTHVVPRLALAYDYSPATTLKLLYGEAWQEPPTIQVYGGWNGRNANPDLRPERATNRELVWMHATPGWQHEGSLYAAHYRNAIREDALNAAGRDIVGVEYRGRFSIDLGSRACTGTLYYTWTHARDDQHYDSLSKSWQDGADLIGDIARHKLQLNWQLPLSAGWELGLRSRYVGKRQLYGTNPLRAAGDSLPAYMTADLQLLYRTTRWEVALQINNLADAAYEQPGIAYANAGVDTTQRAQGYYNSLLPQPGRSVYGSLSWRY